MGLLESLLIGFAVAAIPGAVFFEVIRRTLTRGLYYGVLLAVGEFIGHVLILLLIFFGISSFLTHPTANIAFYLIGSILMLWLSISAFRVKRNHIEKHYRRKLTKDDSIFVGFGISVTDPFIIALWISLSGSYLLQYATPIALINILFIALGFLVFFIPAALIVNSKKDKISSKYVIWFSRISGIMLLFTAISFLYGLLITVSVL